MQAEKFNFHFRDVSYIKSEITNFLEDVKKAIKNKNQVYILLDTKEKIKRLQKILEEEKIPYKTEEKLDQTIIAKSRQNQATITLGNLSQGFQNYDANQLVIKADELINSEKRKYKVNTALKEREKAVIADLKVEDYVVHKKYGIGIYVGVNTIKADGTIKDYIKIKYKNDDILYIPTSDLDSIRKYIGGDKIKPKTNRLGSKDWENTKAKVKNNLREIAKELIELYAAREKIEG